MDKKTQGDIGVAAAILFFSLRGHVVSIPNTERCRYDLLIDAGGILRRVQVKSTGRVAPSGNYQVTLSTQGGNRSWSTEPKPIAKEECDEVFICCLNGQCYLFPVAAVAGKREITLYEKYDKYEVCDFNFNPWLSRSSVGVKSRRPGFESWCKDYEEAGSES